jgi:hypothetical protein
MALNSVFDIELEAVLRKTRACPGVDKVKVAEPRCLSRAMDRVPASWKPVWPGAWIEGHQAAWLSDRVFPRARVWAPAAAVTAAAAGQTRPGWSDSKPLRSAAGPCSSAGPR